MILPNLLPHPFRETPLTLLPQKRKEKIQEMLSRLAKEPGTRNRIDLLNEISASLSPTDPEKARVYAQEALERAISLPYEKGIAYAYQSLAQVHFCVSAFEEAKSKAQEALSRFLALQEMQAAARTRLILASVHLRKSRQGESMEEALRAIELSESCGDHQGVAIGKNLLGIIYGNQGRTQLAKEQLQASAEIHRRIGDLYRFAMAQINLGNLHLRMGEQETALPYYESAVELLEEMEPEGYPIATLFHDLGEMWVGRGDESKAETFYLQSLALRRKQGNETGVAASLLGMGRLRLSRGEFHQAREAFEEALAIAKRVGIPKEKWLACKGLAETEEAEGNLALALKLQKEAAGFREELLHALQHDRISRLEAEFENKSREREAKLYQLENVRLKEEVAGRRKAEAALVQAQKLESLGLMAGGLAHDFNNMLLCVFGYIELARNSLAKEHPARPLLDLADASAQKASHLAEQMLTYSGGRSYELRPLDLEQFFRSNLNLLQAAVGKQTQISWFPPSEGGSLSILAEEAQLFQALMNLALNAKEAGASKIDLRYAIQRWEEGGLSKEEITGNLEEAEAYVSIEVRDDGGGIDASLISRIFDPFFSTKFTGRGLGLAAVLGIVRGHHGGIVVRSRKKETSGTDPASAGASSWTCFTLLFPFHEDLCRTREQAGVPGTSQGKTSKPRTKGEIMGGNPKAEGKRRILVIDDEPEIQKLLRAHLEAGGFSVLCASDGESGVAAFREHRGGIDLVLLDMTMPGMSALETWKKLKELQPHIPILLSSGYDREAALADFPESPPFLSKPYSGVVLLAAVEEILGGRPPTRER